MTTHAAEQDIADTILNGAMPYNVYLYWYDPNLSGGDLYPNAIPFSHASTLISAQYSPYLDESDFNIFSVFYDTERYGYDGQLKPVVYRINQFQDAANNHPGTKEKLLGSFNCYNPTKSIGGSRNWRNESKLYNYPYSVGYLYDGLSEPLEIKFENCSSNNNKVFCRAALNINADYSIFIENYLNDSNGQMEQNVITSSRDYPCSSSQYASWLATNKNQLQATKTNSSINALQSTISGITSGAMAGLSGGGLIGSIVPGAGTTAGAIGGGLAGAIGGGISGLTNSFKNINNVNATEHDMRNLPNSLISRGSDLTLGINTTEQKLKMYTYRQKEEYMTKIGDYFAMYGYKQNRIMKVNLRDRYYYNYIKAIGCNIASNNNIPIFALDIIKNIFNNGVTIWHIDRSGVNVCDYSKDNKEV